MRMLAFSPAPSVALAAAAVLSLAAPAQAHISLELGGTHLSRYGDGDSNIKDGPCGRDGGGRSTNVFEYKPGETITITIVETLPHPGYFRIAFDDDGDDDFLEPRSVDPVEDHRACLSDTNDQCGASDFYNNDTVLMDNLDPHVANVFSPQETYTWQVTLPNVECDNCTLQIIQVMEDTIHGPYCPKGVCNEANYIEDIYHQCIDLVLKADADTSNNPEPMVDPGTGGTTGGGTTAGGATGGGTAAGGMDLDGSVPTGATGVDPALTGGTASSSESSGCSAGGESAPWTAWLGAWLLGTWMLWRRRSLRA